MVVRVTRREDRAQRRPLRPHLLAVVQRVERLPRPDGVRVDGALAAGQRLLVLGHELPHGDIRPEPLLDGRHAAQVVVVPVRDDDLLDGLAAALPHRVLEGVEVLEPALARVDEDLPRAAADQVGVRALQREGRGVLAERHRHERREHVDLRDVGQLLVPGLHVRGEAARHPEPGRAERRRPAAAKQAAGANGRHRR